MSVTGRLSCVTSDRPLELVIAVSLRDCGPATYRAHPRQCLHGDPTLRVAGRAWRVRCEAAAAGSIAVIGAGAACPGALIMADIAHGLRDCDIACRTREIARTDRRSGADTAPASAAPAKRLI